MRDADVPPGYVRFAVNRTQVVCAQHVATAFREALARNTLHGFAATQPGARTLTGRTVAYALPLLGTVERIVVRHNHHGGLLAPLTRDLFRSPTRAPLELQISERLREYDVPTPKMLGYAIYDAPAGFKRADVVTREVPDAFDLAVAFMSRDAALRGRAITATADLVLTLSAVGARHADLNVKNVLLHPSAAALSAVVLDVDRVTFDEPEIVFELNLSRLLRSARKWQTTHGASVTDGELAELAGLVRERRPPPLPLSTSS
jgi:hypothetical protein